MKHEKNDSKKVKDRGRCSGPGPVEFDDDIDL